MNIATIRGIGPSEEGERIYCAVFNGTKSEVKAGDALCWDITSSDGKTVTQPTVGTNISNFAMFAGLAQSNIGTDDYAADVQNYGLASANVYGIATTLVAGAYLLLVAGRDYVAYGTSGMFAGSTAAAQPICMTALVDHSALTEVVENVFIKTL